MAVTTVVPWLLEREYAQHRSLDPALPETFRQWLNRQHREVARLKKLYGGTVTKLVIHPAELETWARQTKCQLSEAARAAFASELWATGIGRPRASAGWPRRNSTIRSSKV